MKFVTCQPAPDATPSQRAYNWLYVVENGRVQVGDIVRAQSFGWMTVVGVGTTREAAGSTYRGMVHVIDRVAPAPVAAAVRQLFAAKKRGVTASKAERLAHDRLNEVLSAAGEKKIARKLTKAEYISKARAYAKPSGLILPPIRPAAVPRYYPEFDAHGTEYGG